jgi:hypothetical protein
MAASVYQIQVAVDDDPTGVVHESITNQGTEGRSLLRHLGRKLSALAGGIRPVIVACRVDSSTEGSTNDPLDRMTRTITITYANITADETVVIGGATLTWKDTAASESEVDIGANLAAATTNLTSKINNHSKLKGIFTASGNTSTGVVTVTYCGDPRLGYHIGLSETGDAVAVSGANFALDTTEAYASASVRYALGIVD